ncbi:MAG: hypothetical protein IPK83_10055 [Planctomycetes bacterium]|nr:hypothetical protein [Planctomycetota bacterium]
MKTMYSSQYLNFVFRASVACLVLIAATPPVSAQCHEWVRRSLGSQENFPFHPVGYQSSPNLTFDFARGLSFHFLWVGPQPPAPGAEPQMWYWSGKVWTKTVVANSYVEGSLIAPDRRTQFATASDSERGVVVLFGGNKVCNCPLAGTPMNDTWEWNGSKWMRLSTSGPPARQNHAMTFDSNRNVIVMFGGSPQVGPQLSDTWEWNGIEWLQRNPATVPPARTYHQIAFDSRRGVTVLFGGYSQNIGGPMAETWEFDGVNWTQRIPEHSPPARLEFGMAFDAARGVTVLFGGRPNPPTPFGDLWEWDGEDWTEITSTIEQAPRYKHLMCYDHRRKKIVLFGGQLAGDVSTDDTWEYPTSLSLEIVTQPTGGNFCFGDDVVLSVEATGNGPLSYQWRRNGFPCMAPGAQTPTLTLDAADWASEGEFDVVVSDSCNSVVSSTASVSLCTGEGGCPSPIDVNGDGTIDGADIQRFVEILLCDCG